MTTQSHTELAALARQNAKWLCERESPAYAAASVLEQCAAALESPTPPERVQRRAPDAAVQPRPSPHEVITLKTYTSDPSERVQGEATTPAGSVSVHTLSRMFESLVDIDKTRPGYHWAVGWNDALRRAMDYATPPTAPAQDAQGELVLVPRVLPRHARMHLLSGEKSWATLLGLIATPAPQAATAGAAVDLVEAIAKEWDGSEVDVNAVGWVDVGDSIRRNWLPRALRASTPAERVPLSEAQIEEAYVNAYRTLAYHHSTDYFEAGARFAERTHGIVTKESST